MGSMSYLFGCFWSKIMTSTIEQLDHKRRQYRRGLLIWSTVFLAAWIVRSTLKIFAIDTDLGYSILLAVLLLAIGFQVFFAIKEQGLKTEMRNEPRLKAALNDERVQLNELKAWRTAFFALIGFIVFSAILSLIVQINDLMYIFLTALLVGFGAYNASVYWLNR